MASHGIDVTRTRRSSSRAFDHILIIMFENQYRGYVLGNPYMRLARQGVQLDNYFGVMHPSQTNYIASIAGELCNVTSMTGRRCSSSALSSTSSKKRRGGFAGRVTWKAMWRTQGLGRRDFEPADGSPYLVKHNPFSSFARIVRSQERWNHIENEAALFADLLNGDFPEYAVYSQYLE
jgi:hypothetical protein